MFRSFCLLLIAFSPALTVSAQAPLAAMGVPYTQDFSSLTGGTDGSTYSWTNNSTLTGWYIDESAGGADDLPILEASYTTLSNTGSSYIFRYSGNQSIGSRASGGTNTIYYGVRLVNNTGSTITSLYVSYYGEQWSIAENNSNINTNTFDYQVGTTMTALTGGTWTNVPALSFTQLYNSTQSSGMGGSTCGGSSAQCLALNGTLAANRTQIAACISVSIPAGNEIMLRWVDIDNPANDHHLQIDDVEIWPFDVSCATVLPVELTSFDVTKNNDDIQLEWNTASEKDNNYFSVERSFNGETFLPIGQVSGHGNSSQQNNYHFTDPNPAPGIYYYRLRQVDYNGRFEMSPIRAVTVSEDDHLSMTLSSDGTNFSFHLTGNEFKSSMEIYSVTGQLLSSTDVTGIKNGELLLPEEKGLYFVRLISGDKIISEKILK